MKVLVFLMFVRIFLVCGYEDLSANKSTGQTVTGICLPNTCEANNAVDRNINTCMRTEQIGTSGPVKSTLWYVDLGNIHSIHSIRIQFKDYGPEYAIRQRGRFAGFSLYVSNTTNKENGFRCYTDGPELPPLDFNTTCVTHGRFVIYYNERLDGISYPTGYETVAAYTELCEVTVAGCGNSGVLGYNCDLPCPSNCQEHRCDIINGTCLGCISGWTGNFCNISCVAGYYGLECRTPCVGHCRDNKPCNHSTGECDEGCADGWTGSDCNKQCPAETYGPGCMYSCSGHCINGVPCDRTTGRCNSGCEPGYTGELCDKVCSVGFYGLNCSEECDDQCRNNHCNHEDGHCEHGCLEGFQGHKCNKTCNEGWYGVNCSLLCSSNCVNQTCHHIQGNCLNGCHPGWMGVKCNEGCSEGMYGKGCVNQCSGHCFNNMTCNPVNGSCTEGCVPGYFEDLCKESCTYGTYGINCAEKCSKNCYDVCDKYDGSCVCSEGWMGSPDCRTECPTGFYGLNCKMKCSGHCTLNATCSKYDGHCPCGCVESYEGPRCDRKRTVEVCNIQSDIPNAYIAGLTLSVIFNIFLIISFTILLRSFYNREKELRSSHYCTSTGVFQASESNANDTHNYQELDVSNDNSYQNLSLRNFE